MVSNLQNNPHRSICQSSSIINTNDDVERVEVSLKSTVELPNNIQTPIQFPLLPLPVRAFTCWSELRRSAGEAQVVYWAWSLDDSVALKASCAAPNTLSLVRLTIHTAVSYKLNSQLASGRLTS